MISKMSIGELLRRYRIEASLTQQELARMIGYDDSLVSRVERGHQMPSIEFLKSFLEALQVSDNGEEEVWSIYRSSATNLPEDVVDKTQLARKPKHNLPHPNYGQFIGRERELAQIHDLLRPYPRSQYGVVVIDGIGGIGKSALALRVAHQYLQDYYEFPEDDRFEAIIWTSAKTTILRGTDFVPRQQSTRNLEDIYAAISITLEREDITRAPREEQDGLVRRALTNQRTLLILDNLETIDDESVVDFIAEIPAPTKVLITTRHRIHMAYPVRLMSLAEEEGVKFIEQTCAEKLVPLEEVEAKSLYEKTGGVPLAIEWAIALLDYSDIDTVLSELEKPISDITQYLFMNAVDLIRDSTACNLLMALALFATDVNRDSLGYVAGLGTDILKRDTELTQLERLSLINRKGDRLSLLPMTKLYAIGLLEDNPQFDAAAQERLVEYYINFVSTYPRSDFRSHILFETELQNILHLLNQCYYRGQYRAIAEIMRSLDVFLWVRGYWAEATDHLKTTLLYAQEENDLALQAHANRALGRIYLSQLRLEVAEKHLKDAYEQYKQVNNVSQSLSSASYLSFVYAETGRIKQGRQLLEDNLAWALSEEEYESVVKLQNTLAEFDIEEENFDKARRRVQDTLDLSEQISLEPSTIGIGSTYLVAGKLAMREQKYGAARGFFEKSLNIAQRRGIEQDKGYATLWMANLLRAEGKLQEAIDKAWEAFSIFSRIGDERGASDAHWLAQALSERWGRFLKRWSRVD